VVLRAEAAKHGWIPLQVSWLSSGENNPLRRHMDVVSSPPRRFSDATRRLALDNTHLRNQKTQVARQVFNLEEVMKSRMRIYQSTTPAMERQMVDGETAFPLALLSTGSVQPLSPSASVGSLLPPLSPSGAPTSPTSPLFLRPQREKGVRSVGQSSSPSRQFASVNHGESLQRKERPWTTSHTVPSAEEPDSLDTPWQSLLVGNRPWAHDRDEGMQRLLTASKGFRRFSDASAYAGGTYSNTEKNVFYMGLNNPGKPVVRGF